MALGWGGESLQKNPVYFMKFRDNFLVPKEFCWERTCRTELENTVWELERADIRAGTHFAQAVQLFSTLNVTFPHLCVDVSRGGYLGSHQGARPDCWWQECNKHHLIARRREANGGSCSSSNGGTVVFMISLFNIKGLGSTLGGHHRTPHCTLKICIVLPFANLSREPCHFCGL